MIKLGQIVFALAVAGSISVVACGGDDGSTPDAGSGSGSGLGSGSGSGSGSGRVVTSNVTTVDCAGATPAATVTAPGQTYVSTPAGAAANESDIAAGSVIKFDLTTAPNHPVGPAPSGNTDTGIKALSGAVTCLKFPDVGTLNYICTVHGFAGKVVVH